MKKTILAVILCAVILSLALTSCYDHMELEDIAWVQAVGFDAAPEGIMVTVQLGIQENLNIPGSQGNQGQGAHYITMSLSSKTAFEAFDMAALSVGRTLSFVHTQLVLFGEEFAKSDLRTLVQAMDHFREFRGTMLVAVAKGTAADILRVNNSPLEVSPSRFIQTLIEQHKHTGLFKATVFTVGFVNLLESPSQSPVCPVLSLAQDYEVPEESGGGGGGGSEGGGGGGGGDARTDPAQKYTSTPKVGQELKPKEPSQETALPESPLDILGDQLPKLGGGPIVMMGTAAFQRGALAGYLTGEETRAMLMLTNDFDRGAFVIPDPEAPHLPQYSVSAGMLSRGTKIKVTRNGDTVQIDAKIDLVVSHLAMRTQTDYTDPRKTPVVKQALEDYVKRIADRTVAKAQAMESDIFGFGKKVKRTFLTWPEFRDFDWLGKFPQTTVNVTVSVDVKRYGLALGPLQVPPRETMP